MCRNTLSISIPISFRPHTGILKVRSCESQINFNKNHYFVKFKGADLQDSNCENEVLWQNTRGKL